MLKKAYAQDSYQMVYRRINQKRIDAGLTWSKLAKLAHIPMGSWMTGVSFDHPSDEEIRKIAPVVNSTFEYLRYGTEPEA